MKKTFTLHSEEDTNELARLLAAKALPGQVFALTGDLGAGKTTFVRAFVRSLTDGQYARVKSPSYALLNTYETTPRVLHLDLYRLHDVSHFEDLGLYEAVLSREAVVVIEWPELILDLLPENTLYLKFTERDDNRREVEVVCSEGFDL